MQPLFVVALVWGIIKIQSTAAAAASDQDAVVCRFQLFSRHLIISATTTAIQSTKYYLYIVES